MAKHDSGTPAPTQNPNTTAEQPFLACHLDYKLFAVRDGVPSTSALEQASLFLAAALDIANRNQVEAEASWGAIYLIEMAKAIIDSVMPNLETVKLEGGAA